jgi:hypothetical protein
VVLKRKKCTYGNGGVSNAYNYFHYYHSLGKVIKISTWIKILTMNIKPYRSMGIAAKPVKLPCRLLGKESCNYFLTTDFQDLIF